MRLAAFIATALLASCGEQPTDVGEASDDGLAELLELGPGFVDETAVRRDALQASLVDPGNGYSQLRLQNYAVPGGWDELPIRNFAVRPVTSADIGAFASAPYRATEGDFAPAFDPDGFEWTHEALLKLGRHAFHNYPLELSNRFAAALADDQAVGELGLRRHDGRVGGVVRARLADGSETFAATCATCHSSVVDGELVDGRANAAIDNSAMVRRAAGIPGTDWGPGAADVTPDHVSNPVAITDLRAVRHQQRLHWAATLYNSPAALAVRVDTLLITSANEAMRPPREVSVALAYYLWSLGEPTPTPDPTSPGAEIFERDCASCHGTLDAVPLAMVGTDPAAGLSSTRGTGDYRVPALHAVSTRSQFLHEGTITSLEQLFDRERLDDVPGHSYGTDLPAHERAALLAYLDTL